jgi:hypothetical protein
VRFCAGRNRCRPVAPGGDHADVADEPFVSWACCHEVVLSHRRNEIVLWSPRRVVLPARCLWRKLFQLGIASAIAGLGYPGYGGLREAKW